MRSFGKIALGVVSMFMSLQTFASTLDARYLPGNYYRGTDAAALKVCNKLDFSSNLNSCLEAIQGRRFSSAGASICAEMDFDSGKISCLNAIANKSFQTESAQLCKKADFNSGKLSCIQKVGDNLYQPAALKICDSQDFASGKNACLDAIANKFFDPSLLAMCGRADFDHQTTGCLERLPFRSLTRGYTADTYRYEQSTIDLTVVIDLATGRVILSGGATVPNYQAPAQAQNTCVVKQTGEVVDTNQFYRLVAAAANRANKCGIGRLANTAGSSRLYDSSGRRVAEFLGGLTYEQLDDVKRANGMKGCVEYICDKN